MPDIFDDGWVSKKLGLITDEEEREAFIKGLAQKRADHITAQRVARVKGTVESFERDKRIEEGRRKMLAQRDSGVIGNIEQGGKPMPRERESVSRAIQQKKPSVQDHARMRRGDTAAIMGTDIEGALEQPGAQRTIINGRVAVVGPQGLLATRNEDPSLGDSFVEFAKWGGETSALQFLGNTFDVANRMAATAYMRDIAERTGDTERLDKAGRGLVQTVWDQMQAAANAKGETASEGGLVATREYGWGDAIRYGSSRLLKQNPRATLGDLVMWNAGNEHTSDDWEQFFSDVGSDALSRPLTDLTDEDYEFLGLMLSMTIDPLNYVGGLGLIPDATRLAGRGAKAAAQAVGVYDPMAKAAVKVAEPLVAAGRKVSAPMMDVRDKVVDKVLGKIVGGKSVAHRARDIMRADPSITREAAEEMAAQAGHAFSGPMGEQGVKMQLDFEDMAERIAPLVKRKESGDVIKVLEQEVRELPRAQQIAAMKAIPDGVLPRMAEDEAALVRAFKDVPDEAVKMMKRYDELKRAADDLPRLEELANNPMVKGQILAGEVKAFNKALRTSKMADEWVKKLDDINASLPWEKRFEIARMVGRVPDGVAGAVRRAVGGADMRAGVVNLLESAEDVAARIRPKYGERADDIALAANRLGELYMRGGGEMQHVGLLGKGVDLAGFHPHILKRMGEAPAYKPLARRRMVGTENLNDLRQKVHAVVSNPAAHGLQRSDPTVVGFERWLDRSAATQLKKAGEVQERLATLDVSPLEHVDELANANRILDFRLLGEARFEDDIRKAAGKWGETARPMIARAEAAQRLADITVDGKRLVYDAAEAVASDLPAKVRSLYIKTDGGKPVLRGNAFGKDGDLVGDVKRVLEKKGLVYAPPDVTRKLPALEGKVVSKAILKEVKAMAGKMDVESINILFKAIGALNKFWVPLLLATPGFHIRNWMYGEAQLYMAIGGHAANPALAADAHRVAALAEHGLGSTQKEIRLAPKALRKVKEEKRLVDAALEMRRNGLIETGYISELERHMASGASFKGLDPANLASKAWHRVSPWSKRGPTEWGIKRLANRGLARTAAFGGLRGGASATIENMQRAQLYLHLRRTGVSEAKAAETVIKYFFDYTGARLSQTEKSIRQLLPFYQWLRFSNAQIVEAAIRNPKFRNINRMFEILETEAVTGRSQAEDPRYRPEYADKRGAVPLPPSVDKAWRAVLSKLGVPEEDMGGTQRFWAAERPGPNLLRPRHIPEEIAAQGSLVPKLYHEGSTNTYAFGGAPITPGLDQSQMDNLEGVERVLWEITRRPPSELGPYLFKTVGGPWASLLMSFVDNGASVRFKDAKSAEAFLSTLTSILLGQKVIASNPEDVYNRRSIEAEEILKNYKKRSRFEAEKDARGPTPFEQLLLKYSEEDQ